MVEAKHQLAVVGKPLVVVDSEGSLLQAEEDRQPSQGEPKAGTVFPREDMLDLKTSFRLCKQHHDCFADGFETELSGHL